MSTLSAVTSISPTELSSQNAYAKQAQVASEISATERTQKPVNAPAEAKKAAKPEVRLDVPESSLPPKLPVNTSMNAANVRALAEELSQFPDIDQAKVAELVKESTPDFSPVDVGELASSMLDYYQNGR